MERTPLVGVVDDDVALREAIVGLARSHRMRVEAFGTADEVLARLHVETPACLIVDVGLPGLSGLQLQRELSSRAPRTQVIFLTGIGDVPMSVRAIQEGALDFLTKPFRPDALLAAIGRGIARNRALLRESEEPAPFEIVGRSPALCTVLRQIDAVADTEATVLLTGETGSGKEIVARAIHERSRRRSGPMLSTNCAAVPEALFESEFFGSRKGAFTGATRDNPGRFELANGGTIFLDEVGEVPLAAQAKLLRVLQEREVQRVGETHPRKVDVRVIAATNRDLEAEVVAGRFRADLYYRLDVFPLALPPLRARPDDIPILAEHFLALAGRRLGVSPKPLSATAIEQLLAYGWPGNVRQLENAVERALILAGGRPVRFDFLGESGPCASTSPTKRDAGSLLTREALKRLERDTIAEALARTGGRVSGPGGAASLLGMKPTTLYSRRRALGITS